MKTGQVQLKAVTTILTVIVALAIIAISGISAYVVLNNNSPVTTNSTSYNSLKYMTISNGSSSSTLIPTKVGSSTTINYTENSTSSSSTERISNFTSSVIFTSMPCSHPHQGIGGYFYANETSPLYLCISFYYYNSGSVKQVNATSIISIGGLSNPENAISNFTIKANPPEFSIGGPSNENEGIVSEYEIIPNSNSNGSYILDLGWLAPQVEACSNEYAIVVGTGGPNYTNEVGGCITMTTTGTQVVSYPYPTDTLFVDIVGYTGVLSNR